MHEPRSNCEFPTSPRRISLIGQKPVNSLASGLLFVFSCKRRKPVQFHRWGDRHQSIFLNPFGRAPFSPLFFLPREDSVRDDFHLHSSSCKSNFLKSWHMSQSQVSRRKVDSAARKGPGPGAITHKGLLFFFSQRKPKRRGRAAHPCSKSEVRSDQVDSSQSDVRMG